MQYMIALPIYQEENGGNNQFFEDLLVNERLGYERIKCSAQIFSTWHKNCTISGMKTFLFRALPITAGIAIAVSSPALGAGNSDNYIYNSNICRDAIAVTERKMRLPTGIMQAISLAESGRWHKASRSRFAWPWTVTAHGKGRFYPSKDAAIAAVRKLKADGVKNIDVGCMQVNLKYHPKAFETLQDAFDPAINAGYAANLFAKLRRSTRSITRAVAHYHSTTRRYNRPYTKKVVKLWNEERRRFYAAERLKKLAAWRAEKERRKAAKLTAAIRPRR